MNLRTRWRAFERGRFGRTLMFGVGVVLLLAAPIVGLIPGPGGIPFAVVGLTLVLRYARWTKRIYVRLKRRWPKQGALFDWGLRRKSARRRKVLATREAN